MLAGTLFAVLAVRAGAQQMPSSAPIENIRYEVTFDRAAAAGRVARVTTTFDVGGSAGQDVLLSLPDWTPGAYELSYFARWVTSFTATAAGRQLEWDKPRYDSWRVRNAGGKRVTVSFVYRADSLDNAMTWARPDFLLFNGTNLFLYPTRQSVDFPATVTVHTDPAWRVVTGMRSAGGGARDSYSASNYHDLVDMPFFIGRVDVDSTRIADHWVRLATYPAGSDTGAARAVAWDQLARAIPVEVAVFGEVPWDEYTVMQIADSTYLGGASGLEHQNSHVDIVTPAVIGSDFQPSLYAHEIFHSWNVKRLRPADLWPYVYDRAMPTPWLWVSEGITDYYADLAMVRGGIVDARGFYALTAEKMKEVSDVPPVALTDASVNTWIHPVDGTQYTYYPKGSLAGFMLDIAIRDASDNAQSLDSVLRALYETTYKRNRGFTGSDWWSAVAHACGGRFPAAIAGSVSEFDQRYIDGRDPYPWDRVLPLAGLRAVAQQEPRLGVYTQQEAGGVRVMSVDSSGAAKAGVRPGDLLVAVGDIAVTDQRFGEKFRDAYANAAEGRLLAIRIRRDDRDLTLSVPLQFSHSVRIEPDPAASPKAVRIRESILQRTASR